MQIVETALALWRGEKLRYLIVGGWNTAFGFGSFALIYLLLGHRLHYLAIAVGAHVIAVTQSFLTQRTLVFRSRAAWAPEYLRFHVSLLGLLAAQMVAMPILVELLGFSPPVAHALWLMVAVVSSYVVHRSFSFRRGRSQPSHPPPAP